MMEVQKFDCEGLLLIKPKVFTDDRGHFLETYHSQKYREFGIHCDFVQDNESLSHRLVLRGLHFQSPPFAQGKLIRLDLDTQSPKVRVQNFDTYERVMTEAEAVAEAGRAGR